MLYTLFSWYLIGIVNLGIGLIVNKLFHTLSRNSHIDLTVIILLGLAFLAAYAQTLSLITRLNAKPLMFVALFSML